jgi:zinc transporter
MANDEDTSVPAPGTYDPTGLVHAHVLDGRGGATSLRTWDEVVAWTPADGVLWLNLDYSMPQAAQWLASPATGIADTVREALVDTDPRPRATIIGGDDLLVIVRGINVNAGHALEDMISIRGWFQPSRVITLRRRRSRSVKSISEDLERGSGPRDTGELLATLVDRIVEHVGTHVDTLGDEIAAAEDAVLGASRRGGDLRGQLADQRRRAIALRRFLGPQREALAKLAMIVQLRWLAGDAHARLAQNADRMARTVEELDAARDRAAVTQEELQSRLAELTNQRLYVLSVITAVFLPLGFVCSLLGVNVGGVPFQHDGWAFWALCGTFVVGVALQFYIFKKRGWFGR